MSGFDLSGTAKRKIIITAHRGVSGGNIPCNTPAAYEIALRCGADMVEIDVSRTADGCLVAFHPGMEHAQLNDPDAHIGSLTLAEIRRRIRYVNYDRTATEDTLSTLDEVFEALKGRCFINVDKFWDWPEQISETIRRHAMEDQIIVKTAPEERLLGIIEQCAPGLQYLPVVQREESLELLRGRRINCIGAEVLFSSGDSPLCRPDFLRRMHAQGKLLWVNAIVYDCRAVLAAHHSDDTAMRGDPENGWGWLADRGFDIIQTDWPGELAAFLQKTGRLFRKGD